MSKRKPSPPAFDLEAARRKVRNMRYGYENSEWREGFNAALRWVLSEVLTRKGK